MLYIETDQTIITLELFNVIGEKILDVELTESGINMGYLKQGIYLIRIKNNKGEIYTGKVVKE